VSLAPSPRISWHQIPGCPYAHDYDTIFADVGGNDAAALAMYRHLCRNDLFFLLAFGLQRFDVNHPWLVARCQEVESGPANFTLDLWSRESYKSTIITVGRSIQRVLQSHGEGKTLPVEERIGIFSFNRPVAKGFLRQIKQTLEADVKLVRWFPDVFYADPKKESPKWSEDEGLLVKRNSQSKEMTWEAWGLVDGQPTSRHYTLRIYDDIITRDTVTSAEMMAKTADAFEQSASLGTEGGIHWIAGTHWHYSDHYMTLRKNPGYTTRVWPVWDAKKRPYLLSMEYIEQIRTQQGAYNFSCQYLLSPSSPETKKFDETKVRRYRKLPSPLNKYIIVDPASKKKKDSDYTAMGCLGVDRDWNVYLLDAVHAKLGLTEKWRHLSRMAKELRPLRIGYEQYGAMSDVEHYEEKQKSEGVYLPPIDVLGGRVSKGDRILWLEPIVTAGKFFLPEDQIIDDEGNDICALIIEALQFYPHCAHDDLLDMLARIKDPRFDVVLPSGAYTKEEEDEVDSLQDQIDALYDMV